MAAAIILMPNRQRKPRTYRHVQSPLNTFNDVELRQRYRFSAAGINYITDLLRPSLEKHMKRNHAMSVENQVLLGLRFLASGSFLQVVGDSLGYDKSTVSRTVAAFTDALVEVKDQFIKWPSAEEAKKVIRAFYDISNFPNVVGCVDGTQIRIQAPTNNEESFVNRKGYHSSINMQCVCDDTGKFTNVNAMWPGSAHDSHIFRTSAVCSLMENSHTNLETGVLFGDSGYPCRPFLLTPFANPLERHQQRYNKAHTTTRVTIERTFGRWKRRFHVLHSEIRMIPQKACRIVVACAVLHNLAILLNEPMDDDSDDDADDHPPCQPHNGPQDGRTIRDYVAMNFFR